MSKRNTTSTMNATMMKNTMKNSTAKSAATRNAVSSARHVALSARNSVSTSGITIGMDLGDKFHVLRELDAEGRVVGEARISSTRAALEKSFARRAPCVVAIEAGTHSPWVSRALEGWGHTVLVANARKLRAVSSSVAKCDERDAEMLARLARVDRALLSPIRHRGERSQAHLAVLKSRNILVKSRTMMILHCRGMVKSFGARLSSHSADSFAAKVREEIPKALGPALDPVLETIEELTKKICAMDSQIERACEEIYPETKNLRTIKGVGPITALAYVLTIEEKERFVKSRAVGPYLGLVPRRDQSGDSDKQLRITKAGDHLVRRLLVSSAHYILGPFGQDSDLRRWGLAKCERGGKNAKKRAIVAVARKLAVLLHRLWTSGEAYDPFYESSREKRRKEKTKTHLGERKEKRNPTPRRKIDRPAPMRADAARA
jgi:transposase